MDHTVLTLRAGGTGNYNHDPETGSLPSTTYLDMTVSPDTTLGQVWSTFSREKWREDSQWPGSAPPYVYVSDGHIDTSARFLHFNNAHIYDPGRKMQWSVPWALIRIDQLPNLHPHSFLLDAQTNLHITWSPRPQMGQGYGLDWSQFPDWIELLENHWAVGTTSLSLTAYGAAKAVQGGVQQIRKTVDSGAEVLRKKLDEWRNEDVHVSDIADIVSAEEMDDVAKAEMLQLTPEEVIRLRALLDPQSEGIPSEVYSGLHSLSAQRELSLNPTIIPPHIYHCGCNKDWCSVKAVIVATAPGVKIGLDQLSDHFTLTTETVEALQNAWALWMDDDPPNSGGATDRL